MTTMNMNNLNYRTIYTDLDEDVVMVISQISHSVAIIWFEDTTGFNIRIPENIEIYDTTNKEVIKPVKNTHNYAICNTDSYVIKKGEKECIEIKSIKGWEIKDKEYRGTYGSPYDPLP